MRFEDLQVESETSKSMFGNQKGDAFYMPNNNNIPGIIAFFLLMVAAGRIQEVDFYTWMTTKVATIYTVLASDLFMLVISAVGFDKAGNKLSALLTYHLTPDSRYLEITDRKTYDILTALFPADDTKNGTPENGEKKPFEPFSPSKFFDANVKDELSEVPFTGSLRDVIHPENYDKIEDSLKTEYDHLITHTADGKHVTPENLLKTEFYFGAEAAKACELCNLSTAWRVPRNKGNNDQNPDFWDDLSKHKKK